jgi:hypothetical protein
VSQVARPGAVRETPEVAGRLRGRFRRRTLLLGVLVVAVLSGLLVFAVGARPTAELGGEVLASPTYVGTTYAFDGVVCLGSQVAGSTVEGVEVEQARGTTTDLVRGPEGAPTLGFPVDPEAQEEVEGLEVPAGELDCTQRLLVTPQREGTLEVGTLKVRLSYGPGGLLRRTASIRPDVRLEVTGTGPDPRSQG